MIDLFEDGNELVSPEDIIYQKYKVAIVAEDAEGNNKLSQPEETVFVYSIDRRYHFSKEYSQYMPDLDINTPYFTINTVL